MCIIFGAWIQWIYKGLLWEDSGPSGTPLNFLQLPFRICQIWNLVFGNWKALKASTIKNTPVQPKFSLCCLLRWSWPTVLCGVPVRALWIAGYYCIIYGSCYCAKAPEHLCYCQSQKDWTSSTSDTLLSVTLSSPTLLLSSSLADSVTTTVAVPGCCDCPDYPPPNFPYSLSDSNVIASTCR